MANIQPNFEKIKKAIYRKFLNSDTLAFSPLFHTMKTKSKIYWYDGIDKEKEHANEALDQIDIRNVSTLIDGLQDSSLPKWIKKKQFIIDYNKHNMLDLIKLPTK